MQAVGGAKNHAVVMPDADIANAVNALMGAAYGSCGERCMAIPLPVPVAYHSFGGWKRSRQAGDQRQPEVGRRHIQSATSAQQAPGTQPMLAGMNHQAMAELIVMVAQAICLARSGTARWLRQSRTIGPKWG